MIVDNSKPHQLVLSLNTDNEVAPIIETYIGELNDNFKLTLKMQKVSANTIELFENILNEVDRTIIKLCTDCSLETLAKKYGKGKAVKSSEFVKHSDPIIIDTIVKPLIDERTNRIIELLGNRKLYLAARNNPADKEIIINEEEVTTHFHFKLNDEGIVYYPTFRYYDDALIISGKKGQLITNKPCRILIDNQLYIFEDKIEGKKIKPFLTKFNIQVPKSSEKDYFRKFIHQIVENFTVISEGFRIFEVNNKPIPILILEQLWNQEYAFKLNFDYKKAIIESNDPKLKKVYLEERNGGYSYTKINRDLIQESTAKNTLINLGLRKIEGERFGNQDTTTDSQLSFYKIMNWINKHSASLEEKGFIIQPIDINPEKNYYTGSIGLSFKVEEKNDWFDINAIIQVGEYQIPFMKLRKLILNKIQEYTLFDGTIIVLPEEWFLKYRDLFIHGGLNEDGTEQNLRLNKFHFGVLNNLFETNNQQTDYLAQKEKELAITIPIQFSKILRPYQEIGVRWMANLMSNRFGGILADDMGLGKTIQTLCLLQFIKDESKMLQAQKMETPQEELQFANTIHGGGLFEQTAEAVQVNHVKVEERIPTLVVMPTSLIYNWETEIKKFTPKLRSIIYTGLDREAKRSQFNRVDLILTTYGTVRNDIAWLSGQHFKYIICDESQVIKNPTSKVSKSIKELKSDFRLSLTGTPIENSLTDLWSQMSFLNPGILGSYQYFKDDYVIPIEKQGDEDKKRKLKNLINPFILRRTKSEVAKDLPELTEKVYYSSMTDAQSKLYNEVKNFYRDKILSNIETFGERKSQFFILKGLMKLRQIANHPILSNPEFNGESGKFQDITSTLLNIISENHKVLVFSQFLKHLNLIKEFLIKESIPFTLLTGADNSKSRQEEVLRFQNDKSIRIFLISLKAGNSGLNLTEADYVFLADPWWNPAVEQQAINRAHRIGQNKNVMAYKFISKETVEEKILILQEKKRTLSKDLIDSSSKAAEDGNLITKSDVEDLFS